MIEEFKERVNLHLKKIYRGIQLNEKIETIGKDLIDIIGKGRKYQNRSKNLSSWSEKDCMLITYGDSIKGNNKVPLKNLKELITKKFPKTFTIIHILPFFPYSSDEGFSVKNFYEVNKDLGEWDDIKEISKNYLIMSDLVINHMSSQSKWFHNFLNNKEKGKNFFLKVDPSIDLRKVFRPRASSIIKKVRINGKYENIWCTFSHDQIDFNFKNPDVIREFVKIIKFYLDNGIRLFRLDAIAFIWKEKDTNCINLSQTHEIVRLIRTLLDYTYENTVLLTETNILKRENLSYFGNGNEAHWIYNFSLPPLLLHTMINSDCTRLRQWAMTMPPTQMGNSYLNFISSHDGIGLRPAEGLLNNKELHILAETMVKFGGKISSRENNSGDLSPYEINISSVDAFSGDINGPDEYSFERFMCAHAIMLGLEGVPAIYINSFFGKKNDYIGLERTKVNRSINRYKWNDIEVKDILSDKYSHNSRKFEALKYLIELRSLQPAFHPNAQQFILQLGKKAFGFYRQSIDKKQTIFCISNVTKTYNSISLIDLDIKLSGKWNDLILKESLEFDKDYLHLKPFQTVWISNQI